MDPNAPEWAKYISAEMKTLPDRMDRRDEEWRKRDEVWRKRDKEWRQDQKKRDEESRREQKGRDELRSQQQEQRDARLFDGLMKFAQASDAREKRYLEIAHDTHRLQSDLLGVQKGILKLQEEILNLQHEILKLQRETVKQAGVTHALLRDTLKILRMGRNGHGRGLSRN